MIQLESDIKYTTDAIQSLITQQAEVDKILRSFQMFQISDPKKRKKLEKLTFDTFDKVQLILYARTEYSIQFLFIH